MTPTELAYAPVVDVRNDPGRFALAASIFADPAPVREELCADAEAAGLAVHECAGFAALFDAQPRALGTVVLVDVPQVDGMVLAALARLDIRAAHSGAQLVVVTGIAALDSVFACCDQSAPQILVDPTRAERVVALGRAVARSSGSRVRDLSHEDRLGLLRLSAEVDAIAERIGRLARPGLTGDDKVFRLESPRRDFAGYATDRRRLALASRAPLPSPRLVRRIIRQRQLRARFFDGALFADPAWDMLLDLAAARAEDKRVSVTSLCIASGVPPTTALRWIRQLTSAGLIERIDDETDRRRTFLALSDPAAEAMAGYFAAIGRNSAWVV